MALPSHIAAWLSLEARRLRPAQPPKCAGLFLHPASPRSAGAENSNRLDFYPIIEASPAARRALGGPRSGLDRAAGVFAEARQTPRPALGHLWAGARHLFRRPVGVGSSVAGNLGSSR